MMRPLLRASAIAIAVAGLGDPVLSLDRPVRPRITLVAAAHTPSGREDSTRETALSSAVERLTSLLRDDFDVLANRYVSAARAAACPAVGGCIVVTDGSVPGRLSDGATVLGAVRIAAPRVAIVGLNHSRDVHLTAASILDVALEAASPRGETTLQVFDGQALVGRTVHTWKAEGAVQPVAATVNVEWVPLAPGPRRLRVVPTTRDEAGTSVGDEAETVAGVSESRLPILLYEPATTWMGTFVRRALEADPRFELAGRVQVAPPVAVTRGTSDRLRQDALRDARIVIVTAAERLSAGEVELLDRFARIRGGSVVLVPEEEVTGPVSRLLPSVQRSQKQQQEEEPQAVGTLRARDILSFQPGPGVAALASAGDRPVVVTRAIGRGRIVASGALDAWRYRENDAFDRFWTSLVADAAGAAGPTLSVRLDRTLLEPGETANAHLEWRSLDEIPAFVRAEAVVDCSGDRQPIRLWPEGRRGVFTGSVEALRAGSCAVTAVVGDALPAATASFITAQDVPRSIVPSGELERVIRAAGGTVVGPTDVAALAARARETREAARERQDTRPMHSPWWIVPFAACLGGEWILRRRAGLR